MRGLLEVENTQVSEILRIKNIEVLFMRVVLEVENTQVSEVLRIKNTQVSGILRIKGMLQLLK